MFKRIVSYLLLIGLIASPTQAVEIAPARSSFARFKKSIFQIPALSQKMAEIPNREIRFLFNWAKKKRAGIATPREDDQHAYRLLGGAAAVAVILLAVAGAMTEYRIHKKNNASQNVVYRERKNTNDLLFSRSTFDSIKQAIERGDNVKAESTALKRTPLHMIVLNSIIEDKQKEELIDILIKNGAEINAQDKDGRTPLDLAIKEDKSNLKIYLISKGAKTKKELANPGDTSTTIGDTFFKDLFYE